MKMDRFENDYYYTHFPDPQEKTFQYSTCCGCKEDINVGEEVLDVYGVCVHDTYDCLFKAVEAKQVIAGEE
ncbi:hypothetical protein DN757_28555 [Paenibacillus silvae]|uniref:Uncharacterized protein n=1 Tax=Paenibacillus silvae TaxID=1325358 RepID=A0A2W6N8E1_9BACL|nr:hypothetical protein DN757_28555 [Paenibacillus silvae]